MDLSKACEMLVNQIGSATGLACNLMPQQHQLDLMRHFYTQSFHQHSNHNDSNALNQLLRSVNNIYPDNYLVKNSMSSPPMNQKQSHSQNIVVNNNNRNRLHNGYKQTLKAQNLHNILNRIQNIKETNVKTMPNIRPKVSMTTNASTDKDKDVSPKRNLMPIMQPMSESQHKKTVRQLLGERKQRQTTDKNNVRNNSNDNNILQQIPHHVNSHTIDDYYHSYDRYMAQELRSEPEQRVKSGLKYLLVNNRCDLINANKPGANGKTFEQSSQNGIHVRHDLFDKNIINNEFNKTQELQPKPNLTVRQLLAKYRESVKSNQRYKQLGRKRTKSHNTIPVINSCEAPVDFNECIDLSTNSNKYSSQTLNKSNENPIKNTIHECIDLTVDDMNSREYSSVESNSSVDKNSYNLYSEHNYISTEGQLETDELRDKINEIIFEKKLIKSCVENDSHESIAEKSEEYSVEHKNKMNQNLHINHESYNECDFAVKLNLIKARDLSRKPIAYLSAKYPLNEISRSIYAGIDTKKAVLDFPKDFAFDEKFNTNGVKCNKIILNSLHRKKAFKRTKCSNNDWSFVLQNMDLCSPLSQKIIKVFPEFQNQTKSKNKRNVKKYSN